MPEATPNTPTPTLEDGRSALDNLFKEVTTTEPAEPAAPAVPEPKADETPDPAATPEPKPEEKPALETPAAPAVAPKADETPAAPAVPATPATPAAADAFEKVELPPYTKPKTGEAFEKVKALARETITAKDAQIVDLQKQVKDRDEKLKTVLPPEAAKELEDLRTFRRSVDVENDPEFRSKFDGKIEASNTAILDKLAQAGMPPEKIEEIKKLGGPGALEWDDILPKLPTQVRLSIQAKLVAIEGLKDERKAEIEKARKDPSTFEKQRVESRSKAIVDTANGFLKQLPWTAEREIPSNAKPEEKAKIESENAFAKEVQGMLAEDLKQFSPEKFGELAVGTAMAYKFKRDAESAVAEAKVAKTALDTVTKERDALKTELDKIKKAGQTHRRTSATPPPAIVNNLTEPGVVALDRLRDEVTA